jgi:3'(2'), 5'-bisphosphate nucleotidase
LLACKLAREAGAIVQQVAAEGFSTETKGDQSPVTRADQLSDQHLRSAIQAAYPEDGLLTEEGGVHAFERRRVWVVDPLDGTKAFVAAIPGYSVMIGLLEDGVPVMGVVFDPLEGWMYAAARGAGAWVWAPGDQDAVPAVLPRVGSPAAEVLVTTHSARGTELQAVTERGGFLSTIHINSVGIKVGLLVRQRAGVYYSAHPLSFWDTVAPFAIALEAGAAALQMNGEPVHYKPDESGEFLHPLAIVVGAPELLTPILAPI